MKMTPTIRLRFQVWPLSMTGTLRRRTSSSSVRERKELCLYPSCESRYIHLNPVVVELLFYSSGTSKRKACWSEIDTATTGIEYFYWRRWPCINSWSAPIHAILFSYHTFTCRWHARLTSPDTRTSPFSKGSRPFRELQRSDFHLNVQIIHIM